MTAAEPVVELPVDVARALYAVWAASLADTWTPEGFGRLTTAAGNAEVLIRRLPSELRIQLLGDTTVALFSDAPVSRWPVEEGIDGG